MLRGAPQLTVLLALIVLASATATLEAQSLAPTQLQEFNTAVTVVAMGVAYVVLGGIIFALAASFRLLSDKVASFFALLIPEPVPRFTSRN